MVDDVSVELVGAVEVEDVVDELGAGAVLGSLVDDVGVDEAEVSVDVGVELTDKLGWLVG